MRYTLLLLLFIIPNIISAQITGPLTDTSLGLRQNGISTLAVTGDTIWTSPSLTFSMDGTPDWFAPDGIDSIDNDKGRVFSLATSGDTLVAGLGFTSQTSAGSQPAGYGYYISPDRGDTWVFSDFPLDARVDEDTTFVYGGTTYMRRRIIVPEQSPPYSVDISGDVIFSASWASGLLRSTDLGANWERVVLPPFGVSLLTPEQGDYFWETCLEVQNGQCVRSENVYNSVPDDNLKGFAVLVDSQKRVWFGSAGGINISENALSAPIDSISWRNVNFSNDPEGLLARWVIEIREDTLRDRVWMTNWLAESSNSIFAGQDRFGLVYSEDGGLTFEQTLVGEKIFSIGFFEGWVIAAGENGLFLSEDGGISWVKEPPIRTDRAILKPGTEFQAVASSQDRLWVGTTDGLLTRASMDDPWEIIRVNYPLSGGNQYDENGRNVDAYAYPNPFSPAIHSLVRIRFSSASSGNIRVRIFDFGMNLVKELDSIAPIGGAYEANWDGVDRYGRRVANAPYFYVIETPDETIKGKFLLVE